MQHEPKHGTGLSVWRQKGADLKCSVERMLAREQGLAYRGQVDYDIEY